MNPSKLNQIINIIREDMGAGAVSSGMKATGGNLAGLPPEEPPVNRKKKKSPIFLGPKSRTSWLRSIKQG